MKIVILDAQTTNPGDLDWDDLAGLGELVVHERTTSEELLARARGAEVLLTNKTELDGAAMRQLKGLRYIGVLATGYNVVDIEAARALGITVCNVPAYSTDSVAQLVLAFVLHFSQRVAEHDGAVQAGEWAACPDFCFWNAPLLELRGMRMGLIGYGRIGKQVGALAEAFGMEVMAHSPSRPEHAVETVFRESDFISLHCPLSEETENLVNAERLGWMKSSAFLINTGRGPLVDEPALAGALNEGRIAGAGLDVLREEPPAAGSPLIGAKNCVITPHLGWATQAARGRLIAVATENLRAFLAGKPVNGVV